jgi:hypothetical protein
LMIYGEIEFTVADREDKAGYGRRSRRCAEDGGTRYAIDSRNSRQDKLPRS